VGLLIYFVFFRDSNPNGNVNHENQSGVDVYLDYETSEATIVYP
jgi:hypothetical protein